MNRNIKAILGVGLFFVFLCFCVGPIWGIYASANDPTLGTETLDWKAISVSFTVAIVSAFLLFIGMALGRDDEQASRQPTNSELRRVYYPDYMNKQQAQREIATEKQVYNDNMYASGFWADADEYVDYDGNLRKITRILRDKYPNIPDNGIIEKGVAPARKSNVRRSTIIIRK